MSQPGAKRLRSNDSLCNPSTKFEKVGQIIQQNDNSFEWTIEKYGNVVEKLKEWNRAKPKKKQIKFVYFESPNFAVQKSNQHQFYLQCYPRGRGSHCNDHVSIALCLDKNKNGGKQQYKYEKALIKWKISTDNKLEQNNKWSNQCQIDKNQMRKSYRDKFVPICEFGTDYELLSDGIFVISCEIQIIKDESSELPINKVDHRKEIEWINYLQRSDFSYLDDTKHAELKSKYNLVKDDYLLTDAFLILLHYEYTGKIESIPDCTEKLQQLARKCNRAHLELICTNWLDLPKHMEPNGERLLLSTYQIVRECTILNRHKSAQQKTMFDLYKKYMNKLSPKDVKQSAPNSALVNYNFMIEQYQQEFSWLLEKKFPFKEAFQYEKLFKLLFELQNDSQFTNYFVYILLDPGTLPESVTDDIERLICGLNQNQQISNELIDQNLLASFIRSIFYVGKGQSDRPHYHFDDALKNDSFESTKSQQIKAIWASGFQPIVLFPITGISEIEALTREAVMIDALWSNLTNINRGSYKMKLNFHQRDLLAPLFVYKAFIIFMVNGGQKVKDNCEPDVVDPEVIETPTNWID